MTAQGDSADIIAANTKVIEQLAQVKAQIAQLEARAQQTIDDQLIAAGAENSGEKSLMCNYGVRIKFQYVRGRLHGPVQIFPKDNIFSCIEDHYTSGTVADMDGTTSTYNKMRVLTSDKYKKYEYLYNSNVNYQKFVYNDGSVKESIHDSDGDRCIYIFYSSSGNLISWENTKIGVKVSFVDSDKCIYNILKSDNDTGITICSNRDKGVILRDWQINKILTDHGVTY